MSLNNLEKRKLERELNELLRHTATYTSFCKLQKYLNKLNTKVEIKGRRNKLKATKFKHIYDMEVEEGYKMSAFENKVKYTYSDGRTGSTFIGNLWYVLFIEVV